MVAEHQAAVAPTPPGSPAAVLAAWLGDLVAMVHEHIAGLSAEELAFQPDPQGNSIGLTVRSSTHPAWAAPAAATPG